MVKMSSLHIHIYSIKKRHTVLAAAVTVAALLLCGRGMIRYHVDSQCGARLQASLREQLQLPRFDQQGNLSPSHTIAAWQSAWPTVKDTRPVGVSSSTAHPATSVTLTEQIQIEQINSPDEDELRQAASLYASEAYQLSDDGMRHSYLRSGAMPVLTTAPVSLHRALFA